MAIELVLDASVSLATSATRFRKRVGCRPRAARALKPPNVRCDPPSGSAAPGNSDLARDDFDNALPHWRDSSIRLCDYLSGKSLSIAAIGSHSVSG